MDSALIYLIPPDSARQKMPIWPLSHQESPGDKSAGIQWNPAESSRTRGAVYSPPKKAQDGSIIAFFDRKGRGRVKYMMRQHTYEEAQSVLNKIRAVDRILTAFKVLNMSASVLRVCRASGLWTMQVFIV